MRSVCDRVLSTCSWGGYIFEGDDEALERDLEAWWDRIQFGVIFMEILWDMYWILALDLCLLSRYII